MLTIVSGLLTMAAAHSGSLALGGVAGGVVEASLPWVTKAARARKATRLVRRFWRHRYGKPMPPEEHKFLCQSIENEV